jgi:hypothetical protein
LRGAPATFDRGPGRHRRSGHLGAGRGRLRSADRAIVWGAWFQEALKLRRDRG